MAVIEFGPPLYLYTVTMLIGVMLSTSFLAPLNIVRWGWGGIWVEEWFKLHAHYCLKNTV